MMKTRRYHLVTGLLLVPLATTAAVINWGPASDTIGKADLIEGAVVYAVSGGSGATILANTNTGTGGGGVPGVHLKEISVLVRSVRQSGPLGAGQAFTVRALISH